MTYQCPMHQEEVSEQPSDCPQCGMPMVPVEKDGPSDATEQAS